MPLDPESLDVVARTILGEAGNQGPIGKAAVAHVIRNRLNSGRWGDKASDVALARNQFEPWRYAGTGKPNDPERFDPQSKQYQDALQVIQQVFGGSAPDPTGGADHFYAPRAQSALGRQTPAWARGRQGTPIGDHMFFNLQQGAAQPPKPGEVSFRQHTPGAQMQQGPGPMPGAMPGAGDAPDLMGGGSAAPGGQQQGGATDLASILRQMQGAGGQQGFGSQQDTSPPLGRLLFGQGGLPGMMNRTIGEGPFGGKGLVGGPLEKLLSGFGGGGGGAAAGLGAGGIPAAAGGPMNLAGSVGGSAAAGAGGPLASLMTLLSSFI